MLRDYCYIGLILLLFASVKFPQMIIIRSIMHQIEVMNVSMTVSVRINIVIADAFFFK